MWELLSTWWQRGVPLGDVVERGVDGLSAAFPGVFDAFNAGVLWLVEGVVWGLGRPHALLIIGLFTALAFWLRGPRTALFTFLGLLLTLNMGMWEAFVDTLALVGVAEAFVLLLGLPLGVLSGTSRVAERLTEPLLDLCRRCPAFVYLIPRRRVFFPRGGAGGGGDGDFRAAAARQAHQLGPARGA